MRKPKNPFNAEPFEGVGGFPEAAGYKFMIARRGQLRPKDIHVFNSKEDAEGWAITARGRHVRWL